MTHFAILFFLIVFAVGFFTWAGLPSNRFKRIAVAAFIGITMANFAAVIESTGQPKPIQLEWRDIDEKNIEGLAWDEARQIVWIWVRQGDYPISYVLPWPKNKQKFGQLQDQWRRRGTTGDEFSYDADGDIAKVRPPKPMPTKEPE